MNLGPFQISRRERGVDLTRPGWRDRLGDLILAARGKAGLKPGSRQTPDVMTEYYQFLPKLSLLQIRGLAISWMQGNFTSGYDLVSLMLDTWPTALRCQHECRDTLRRTKFLAHPYRVGDDDATKSAEEKAAFVNECLGDFKPVPGTDERGWRGTLYGLGGALVMPTIRETLWTKGRGDFRPRATAWASPRTYGFTREDLGGEIGSVTRLASRVQPGNTTGVTPLTITAQLNPQFSGGEETWLRREDSLVGIYDTRDGGCTLSGLVRPLLWWWGGMMYGRDWLLRYAEFFGQPLRLAYYDPNIKPDDLAVLKDMLANMGAAAWAAFPDTVRKLDLAEGKGVGADNPQRYMIEHGDYYCEMNFHGQSQRGGNQQQGQREAAEFRRTSRTAREESYAEWLASLLKEQLVREILRRNWGTDDECPRVVPDFTEPANPLEQAQAVQLWLQSYDLPVEDAAEISGLPLVEKETPELPDPKVPTGNGNGNRNNSGHGDDEHEMRARGARGVRFNLGLIRAEADGSDKLAAVARARVAAALQQARTPLAERLKMLDALADDAAFLAELKRLQADLPGLLAAINGNAGTVAAANELADAMSAALLNALTEETL